MISNNDLSTPLLLSSHDDDHIRDEQNEEERRKADEEGGITDQDENACDEEQQSSREPGDALTERSLSSWTRRLRLVLWTHILPEPADSWSNISLVKLRLFIFLFVVLSGMIITHYFVRRMKWEHREGLTLYDIFRFESNLIWLDLFVFFVVGRLYDHRDVGGVDSLAFILTMLLSSAYTSFLPNFSFLQHSTSLYDMFCTWPWQLWIFVGALILPICAGLLLLHLRYAILHHDLTNKVLDLFATLILFVVPFVAQGSFEFHHYYAGWLVGMHCNYPTRWSFLCMSWCVGQYVNGISVYGRDPILTCAYAKYISERQHCLRSSWEEICWEATTTLLERDWRNCTAT